MAVQVKLLHQFLLELCPNISADSALLMQTLFDKFQSDPLASMASGLTYIQHLLSEEGLVPTSTLNGMIFGIMIASVSDNPDNAKIFEGFLENQQRGRGEHIVSLTQFKAKRST